MNKRILITGGNGFIARSLYEYLNEICFFPLKANVVCLNRHQLDLLDTKRVQEYLCGNKFDVVIHCATYDPVPEFSNKSFVRVLNQNLKMFFNLARHRDMFGKMIFFGSGAEFGRENWIPHMSENLIRENIPADEYGLSKYIMTNYAEVSDNIFNFRIFGLFGKYDDWRYRFISNACCKAVLGEDIVIKKDKVFDYLYINDLLEVVRWAIEDNPKEKAYNVCTSDPKLYSSLAQKIVEISGKKLEISILDEKLGIEYSGDNTLIKRDMENFALTPLEESLKEMYSWYDSHKSLIQKEFLLY